MTEVKYFALNELPNTEDVQEGSIYFLSNGSQYISKSDKNLVKISDTLFFDELPEVGDSSKLYIKNVGSQSVIYIWDGLEYQVVSKDVYNISTYGIKFKATYPSLQSLNDSVEVFEVEDLILIDNANDESERGTIYKFNGEAYDYVGNIKGLTGSQGEKGEVGERGLSAYEVALSQGFIGDEQAFLDSLRGERGLIGLQGLKGDQGIQGIQGFQGEPGVKGDIGEKGEQGDSFKITKSYESVAELEADNDNPDIPEGSFVIISSNDPDNDPDNAKVYIKTEDGYKFQLIMRGLKGETGSKGERGFQGEQGVNGIQGVKGDQGVKGEDGKSINVKGVLVDETTLPMTGNAGDAYWVNSRLYIWSNDQTVPGWIRGSDLRGATGATGATGLTGAKGDKGDSPIISDATTATKGVVRVGDGLNVAGGLLSIDRNNITTTRLTHEALPSDYPNGVTVHRIPSTDTDPQYIYYNNVIKDLIGVDLPSNNFKILLLNYKDINGSYQTVDIHFNIVNNIFPLYQLYRYQDTSSTYYPWRIVIKETAGKGRPDVNRISAPNGVRYLDVETGITYVVKGSNTSAGNSSWQAIDDGEPDATTTSKGVVQVGSGLNVSDGVISVNNQGVTLTTLPANSPLSAYPNGVVTKNVVISITDADYLYFTGILKTLVGTDLNANQSGGWLRMTSEVIKSGNGYGYQTVKINSNVNGHMYPLFELFRSHGTTEWQPWTCNVVENIGKGAPNGVITGIYGMKYTDVLTNITYIKKGVVDAATSGSWEAINAPKEYSYSSGSTPASWTLNATANTRIAMTGGFTSGITFTGNTFRLKGGKVYKIDLSFGVTTAATSGVIRIGIFNATTNSAADGNKIAISTGANDKGNKSSTVSIIKPTVDTDYYVGIEANSPAGNFTSYSQNMTIVEI